MKLVRCVLQPHQLDCTFDRLQGYDISSMTVTNGGERCLGPQAQVTYRGCSYPVRFRATAILELTVADYLVEDIIREVRECCEVGVRSNDDRILVMSVDDAYAIRMHEQRIA